MYDILIRNGMVFDGSGSAPERVDVAVKDGAVVTVASEMDRRSGKGDRCHRQVCDTRIHRPAHPF